MELYCEQLTNFSQDQEVKWEWKPTVEPMHQGKHP